jgi:hypothetical protein
MVTDEVVRLSGFGRLARTLGDEARRSGLAVPGFRSPPRVPGVTRTIRRAAAGAPVVAVALQGRPAGEVIVDMIDGIVAANGLRGVQAEQARLALSRTVVRDPGESTSVPTEQAPDQETSGGRA